MRSPRLLVALALVAGALSAPASARATHWTPVPYSSPPASYDDLPMGEPTTLPWIEKRRLHIGDVTIRTGKRDLLTGRSGTYLVGKGAHNPQHDKGWWLVVGDHLERLPARHTTRMPYISANGRWISWVESDRPPIKDYSDVVLVKHRIVIYDAKRRRVVEARRARRLSEQEDGSNEIWLLGLDNTGRALLQWGESGDYLLSRSGRLVRLKAKNRYSTEWDGWPRGAQLIAYSGAYDGAYGRVSKSGRFTELGRVPTPGTWSPTGGALSYDDYYGETAGVTVYRLEDGTAVEMGLPDIDQYIGTVGWESETSVLLWRSSNRFDDVPDVSFFVRCNAETGDCERVPNGPARVRGIALPQLN